MRGLFAREKGQGLVEYSLILVLVAGVVIVILLMMGPAVGGVFSDVAAALQQVGGGGDGDDGDDDPIVSVSAVRLGGEHANDVTVSVTVSRNTTVKAEDSQSGHSVSLSCNDGAPCQGMITSVGSAAGSVTFTAGGYSHTASYGAKP